MSKIITELTPEQEALIPIYREKWRSIALSTEPIDRQKATEAVKAVYNIMNKPEPSISFFDSPLAALNTIINLRGNQLESKKMGRLLSKKLLDRLECQLYKQVWLGLRKKLNRKLLPRLEMQLYGQVREQFYADNSNKMAIAGTLESRLFDELYNCINPEMLAYKCSWLYFCIDVLNCHLDRENWELLQFLVKYCGWMFIYDRTCFACDRPRIISFDNQQRLHGEGEPAIKFADGFSVYAYHGVRLPEKYGKLPPCQWSAECLCTAD